MDNHARSVERRSVLPSVQKGKDRVSPYQSKSVSMRWKQKCDGSRGMMQGLICAQPFRFTGVAARNSATCPTFDSTCEPARRAPCGGKKGRYTGLVAYGTSRTLISSTRGIPDIHQFALLHRKWAHTHNRYGSALAMATGFKRTVDLYELDIVESVMKFCGYLGNTGTIHSVPQKLPNNLTGKLTLDARSSPFEGLRGDSVRTNPHRSNRPSTLIISSRPRASTHSDIHSLCGAQDEPHRDC